MKRTKTKYNKVVNFDRESNEIIVLSEIFDYGNGFHGATGDRFVPISREEYEERINDHDELVEYLMDSVENVPEEFRRGGFEAWADAIEANDEVADIFFDQSYSNIWDSIREQCGLTEDEAYIFDCRGGGRMFNKDFVGNMNPDICELIRKAETE